MSSALNGHFGKSSVKIADLPIRNIPKKTTVLNESGDIKLNVIPSGDKFRNPQDYTVDSILNRINERRAMLARAEDMKAEFTNN